MHQQTAGDYPPNPRHELSHRLRIVAGEHHPWAEAPGPRRAATPLAAGGLQPRARTLASQPVAGHPSGAAGWGCALRGLAVASTSAAGPLRATPGRPRRHVHRRGPCALQSAWPWHDATVPQGRPAGALRALFVPIPQGSRTTRGACRRGARSFAGRPGPRARATGPVHVRAYVVVLPGRCARGRGVRRPAGKIRTCLLALARDDKTCIFFAGGTSLCEGAAPWSRRIAVLVSCSCW